MKSKQKIVFYMRNLALGGITVSLLNLLKNFDDDLFDITLLVAENNAAEEIVRKIPSYIHLKFVLNQKNTQRKYKYLDKKEKAKSIKGRIFCNIVLESVRLYVNWKTILMMRVGKYKTIFDFQGMYLSRCLKFLSKSQKISVVHENKYAALTTNKKINELKKKLEKYDIIVMLTRNQCSDFQKIYPKFRNKFCHIYNPFDIQEIQKLSDEPLYLKKDKKCGLMLARLSHDKDFDTVLEAFSLLKKREKLNFDFYFLGEGSRREELTAKIKEMNLEKNIFLLGYKSNPYNWIKKCDFLLMSSYIEGLNNTIIEGVILEKIVISSKFQYGAAEVLEKGNGFLFENGDSNELANILEKIITEEKSVYDYFPEIGKAKKQFDAKHIANQYMQIIIHK